MGMRPAARMPKLTRRSRTLIAIALTVIGLLLVGPRLIDAYVDWLWFGELGYRSVFTTVLATRLIVFVVIGLLVGGIVFAGLALAYRTRPVFVPSNGTDPVARYRTAVMSRLRVIGIGVPVTIGLLAGIVAQTYWVRIQLFLHGSSFGVRDPQFGKDLGFYAFELPFYRLVLSFFFVAMFLAFVANLLAHYVFGGIRLSGRTGALSRSARIQLISLVGTLVLLKAVAYWLDRYELLSHTRARQAVHRRRIHRYQRGAAGQADPAGDRVDLRGSGVLRGCAAGLADSSHRPGAAAAVVDDRRCGLAADRRAVQRQTQCGAEGTRIHQPKHHRDPAGLRSDRRRGDLPRLQRRRAATAEQVASDRATTSNIRLLDPTIVSPAFTQFQQGKNFYYFPDQLSIDRYRDHDGNLRDYVVAARELNPDHLIDNQRDWINRHTVYTHGNGFIASPANTVRGIANDPNQNGGYPEFLASVVGANGSVIVKRSRAAGSAARLLRAGDRQLARRLRDRRQERCRPRIRLRDQHRDQELHLHRRRWSAAR